MAVVKKGEFDAHTYVVQSALIDPQYEDRDRWSPLMPAVKPGQLMYDNLMASFELAIELANAGRFYDGMVLDLHRTMTRGIEWYESNQCSGLYRRYDLVIGNKKQKDEILCPSHLLVESLMQERWCPKVQEAINSFVPSDDHEANRESALNIAWAAHHAFEYIHPLADGNGRIGRHILNHILVRLGQSPVVIWYRDRFMYYRAIQEFRQHQVKAYLGLSDDWVL
ncbi:MAG: Fic family protein [Armatimonadetes bacterium]|nr:Fic family protein [Armatimonadota bacterium]